MIVIFWWKYAFVLSSIKSISFPHHLTCICSHAFYFCENLCKIEIPSNSQLKTIDDYAFCYTKLTDLKDKWSIIKENMKKITVDPNNPRYKNYGENGELIIGKESIESENFDVLVYCSRDVESIKIPDFIKTIKTCAFIQCKSLKKLEISVNSNLKSIEKESFYYF